MLVCATETEELLEVSRAEKVEDGFVLYTRDGNTTLQELVRLSDRQGFRLSGIRTEIPKWMTSMEYLWKICGGWVY